MTGPPSHLGLVFHGNSTTSTFSHGEVGVLTGPASYLSPVFHGNSTTSTFSHGEVGVLTGPPSHLSPVFHGNSTTSTFSHEEVGVLTGPSPGRGHEISFISRNHPFRSFRYFSQSFSKFKSPLSVRGWDHIWEKSLPGMVAMSAPIRAQASTWWTVRMEAAIISVSKL